MVFARLANQMECPLTLTHRIDNEPPVKGCQLASIPCGQRKQVGIGDLGGPQQPRWVHFRRIEQPDVIRPKGMPGQFAQRAQNLRYHCRRSWRVCISRAANDSQNGVFRYGTGRPLFAANAPEPAMCQLMMDVPVINQSDQHIYISEISWQLIAQAINHFQSHGPSIRPPGKQWYSVARSETSLREGLSPFRARAKPPRQRSFPRSQPGLLLRQERRRRWPK